MVSFASVFLIAVYAWVIIEIARIALNSAGVRDCEFASLAAIGLASLVAVTLMILTMLLGDNILSNETRTGLQHSIFMLLSSGVILQIRSIRLGQCERVTR